MKIFVYRNKKNYGPYSLDILREFLKKSLLSESDLFCYDKKNWVKLSEVPGMTTENVEPVKNDPTANPKEKLGRVQLKKEQKTKTDSMLQLKDPLSINYIASCILKKPKDVFEILSERGLDVKNNCIDRHTGIDLINEFITKSKLDLKDGEKVTESKSNGDIIKDYNKYPFFDDSYIENRKEDMRIALDCGGSISHTDDPSSRSLGIEDSP
jgi:hypothetical protein